jgi:hypothetical protein
VHKEIKASVLNTNPDGILSSFIITDDPLGIIDDFLENFLKGTILFMVLLYTFINITKN